MKQIVKKLLHRYGYQLSDLRVRHQDMLVDKSFAEVYARARENETTLPEGLYALYNIVRYLVDHDVPGALIDGAAWKCGGAITMIETLRTLEKKDRDVFAFDLFDQPDCHGKHYWDAADFEAVKTRVYDRDYPGDKIHLVAGDVMASIPARAPEQIALLRMDFGRGEATRHCLTALYPRVAPGGCVLIKDYGSYYQQSGLVMEEFLAALHPRPLVHRVDQFARYWIKPTA